MIFATTEFAQTEYADNDANTKFDSCKCTTYICDKFECAIWIWIGYVQLDIDLKLQTRNVLNMNLQNMILWIQEC